MITGRPGKVAITFDNTDGRKVEYEATPGMSKDQLRRILRRGLELLGECD